MINIHIRKGTRQRLHRQLEEARKAGDTRLSQRILALVALSDGNAMNVVAEISGVSEEAIRIWVRDFILRGLKSLRLGKSPGRPSKLVKSQRKELAAMIEKGPEAAGFSGGCWRSPMIQALIEEKFGALYSVRYISQLLRNMGFSFQKASFESDHLDKKARRQWIAETWPNILELAKRKNAYIMFGDEASFPQWGTLSYTWAPRGETPVVKTSGIRKGYKVFGLIEFFTGKFFSKAQEGRLNSETYIEFLKDVLASTRKHLIIIQDGAKYHVSKKVKQFFADCKDRVSVFQLPSYSPDYNPIEMLWKKIKQKGTHLKYFPTFESLIKKVDEMLLDFGNLEEEVLKLFGLYCPRKLG
jgi:transposase